MDADWDRIAPALTDDGLLLAETTHRTVNEISSAMAALTLVRAGRTMGDRGGLVDAAIARLAAFAAITRLMAGPWMGEVDLGRRMEELWEAMAIGRAGAGTCLLTLDVGSEPVPGGVARRVLLVVAELVQNALRHAMVGREGMLAVVVRRSDGEVRAAVVDDGPGLPAQGARRDGGMGGPLVAELVRRGGGTLECETGPRGTSFRVMFPIASEAAAGEPF